jgi:RNA polymerase sigma-70 factor (ECF subfamily)
VLVSVPQNTTSLADASDEQLVAAYQQSGDADAVAELVSRHVAGVRRVVFPMVLDETVADDLTQEALLRALRGLPKFRGKAAFSTWLHRVALNTTYDYLKRKKHSPVEYRREVPDSAGAGTGATGSAELAELDAHIQAALADLSPKLRAAIVLTAFQQWDAQQAARVEGCTVATMYWRIHEARKQLRSKLKPWLSA